jgi:hypothetical protein
MYRGSGHWVDISQGKHIAGFVHPSLEVGGFGGPDAEKDSQDLHIVYPLSQRRISLLPHSSMVQK